MKRGNNTILDTTDDTIWVSFSFLIQPPVAFVCRSYPQHRAQNIEIDGPKKLKNEKYLKHRNPSLTTLQKPLQILTLDSSISMLDLNLEL